MPIKQETIRFVACDNAACPNVGNYEALKPPLTTDDPTGWLLISAEVVGAGGTSTENGVFCSFSCAATVASAREAT